jgi:O-antigen ligase
MRAMPNLIALPASADRADLRDRLWAATACAAIAIPSLLAFNLPPSATFLNQAAALVGWAVLLLLLAASPNVIAPRPRGGLAALLAALTALAAAAAGSWFWAGLPSGLALSAIALIAATALVLWTAAAVADAGRGALAFQAFCIALLVAGVLSAALGMVQVFAPQWADGNWIAAGAVPGRASGNLRQPNHLSSLLLWSAVAGVWLLETGRLRRDAAALLGSLFMLGLVLSASRTGTLGVLVLALWGVLDRQRPRAVRIMLLLAPVVYALCWLGLTAWAQESHQAFGATARLTADGDISSSRFGIWSNTLSLIALHPWLGVGFGEFNFAWSLTPFPHRPVAFFDHTHNLPLHFAVELGLPLALAVLGLLSFALWRAWRASRDTTGARADTALRSAAFMMVFMMVLHSQLEYPLWYAYFLLPTAFAFGLCLGMGRGLGSEARPSARSATERAPQPTAQRTRPLVLAALLMLGGSVAALFDYMRVVVIFTPAETAASLSQRIADGQRSWFFAHHADYAAVTTTAHPSEAMASFKVAPHYLLDTRLMMTWATALAEAGDLPRARFIAQRLIEFRNEDAKPFFEPCNEPRAAGVEPPYQCVLASDAMDYRDFR